MKQLYRSAQALLLGAILALTVTACASLPQDPTQAVFVAQTSLTVATNALADIHDKELSRREAVKRGEVADGAPILSDESYAVAKKAAIDATDILKKARGAAATKDYGATEVLLTSAIALIDKITLYNGGKK